MPVCTWVCALSFGRCRMSKFFLLVYFCFLGSLRPSLDELLVRASAVLKSQVISCLGSFQNDLGSFWNDLNHATLRRSVPRRPGCVGWLRQRPRTGGRVKACGKPAPVPTLAEPRTFEQCVLKEEHSNQTSGHGAGI